MSQIPHITVIFYVFLFFLSQTSAQTLADRPYQISLFAINGSGGSVNDSIKTQIEKSAEYCRTFAGTQWNIRTEELEIDTDNIDWSKFNTDKLFIITLNYNADKIDNFELQEIDIQIRRCGIKKRYEINSLEKLPDLLFQAMLKHFSPIIKIDNRVSFNIVSGFLSVDSLSEGRILIPFVRTLDREGNTVSVEEIPYTVLAAESVNSITNTVKCRIISGLPNALSAKRRGRTETIAAALSIAEQEEMKSTVIRLQLPLSAKNVPVYDIYEILIDEKNTGKKAVKVGRNSIDGVFELPAEPERPLRIIQIRSGNSLFAQFPVVRSYQSKITVPIADAPVRTEAESYLKGLQDEFIDTLAKKIILQKRLDKIRQETDAGGNNSEQKSQSKVQNDIMNLKSKERFLSNLEQGRQRFHSDIPAVQRRIDRMFSETEKAFRSAE